MRRTPPRGNNALFSTSIFKIEKVQGTEGATYYLESLSRVPVSVRNYGGEFVRYGGAFRRLYPEKDLLGFLKSAKDEGCCVVVNGVSYSAKKHGSKPFILDWEKSIGLYYDPSAR